MIEEPNKFYEEADCAQCKALTDIKKQGCNYSCVMTLHVGGGNAKAES